MKKHFLFFILCFYAFFAMAYEGPIHFQIKNIFVSTHDDLYFRVISADDSWWHCDGGPKEPGQSYVDFADPAAKAKIAALMLAYTTQKYVDVLTEQTVVNGLTQCKIMQVQVY